MFLLSRISIVFCCAFPTLVYADTDISKAIRKNLATSTGIITFLTSQESVSAGTYAVEQTSSDTPSSSFSTFKLPYRKSYRLHEDGSQWSMLLGYGRFDMNQKLETSDGPANSSWQANAISAGIGYSKNLNPDIRWFSTLELAYSQIYHDYSLSSTRSNRTSNVNFDWRTNALSLIPAVGLRFPLLPKNTSWKFETRAVYLFTSSVYAGSNEEVSAQSTLWVNKIDFGEPWTISMNTWGVAINPQLNRTDAYGKVHDALATEYWYEANLNFRLKSYEDDWWNNLSYGFSYLQGKHFRGGQLNISFNFDQFYPR